MNDIDIWMCICKGFGIFDLDNVLVESQIQWYSFCFDYIQCIMVCVLCYLFYVVQELEKCGMFIELVLLFFIELVFNLEVFFIVKVVGMWQFIFFIGCDYNFKQNMFIDECCDVLVLIDVVLIYL